jgi:2-haloacid dehalogenase
MPLHRRQFLTLAAGGTASLLAAARPSLAASPSGVKAILFDAFAVLDPRPVAALAETLFPGKGSDLSNAWRARQFEYTWLRAAAHEYRDFWHVTEDALVFAARSLHLDLAAPARARLMAAHLELKAYPEAMSALRSLKEAGHRLAFLANLTPMMLRAGIQKSGLDGMFDALLSTDRVKTYKPDPRAYQMGVDAFRLHPGQIVFVPSAGWDAAGARWFGYRTFWVNRSHLSDEELGVAPDGSGSSLADLVRFVSASAP